MLDYLASHHAQLLYLIAGVSFVIELTLMGLSGPLLFFAIGTFVTALLVSFNVIHGWEAEVISISVITLLAMILLWRPLKRLQEPDAKEKSGSDLIGRDVLVISTVTLTSGAVKYSGARWNARLEDDVDVEEIAPESLCKIVRIKGNTLFVVPK